MTTNYSKRTLSLFCSAIPALQAALPGMLRASAVSALMAATCGITLAQIKSPVGPVKTVTVYNLTDLSGQWASAGWSFAYAINDSGQTVGDFIDLTGAHHAFRTEANAQINYFGSPDDMQALPNQSISWAYAINAGAAVVGDSSPTGGPYSAYVSSGVGAAMQDLNSIPKSTDLEIPSVTAMHTRGINDHGWFVGYFSTNKSSDDPMFSHSFLSFGPGMTTSIDDWYGNPAYSATFDVNNLGSTAGSLTPAGNLGTPSVAFYLNGAGMHLIKIGTLPGGTTSVAYSLNDAGQVVGTSQIQTAASYGSHAFLFQDVNNNGIVDAGELKDLDTMNTSDSGAMCINSGGVAVGYYGSPDVNYGSSRAAIFSGGSMQDLNGLVQGGTNGWTLRVAEGINSRGQIVGFMQSPTGAMHAFRLDPQILIER